MSKLRCIEVGEGYEGTFTLNKKYTNNSRFRLVSDDFGDYLVNGGWDYDDDDLCVLSIDDDPDSSLVARFEVVE